MAETVYSQTGVTFDPDVGLSAPSTEEIRESIAQAWKDAFAQAGGVELDTDPTTPAGQLIDAQVAEIEAKNAEILFLANQFNPKTAEGRWQDALGYFYYLPRKTSEPTVVTCQLTGLYGTQIPYGAIVQNTDGYSLICNSPVQIGEDGTAETTFRCATPGAIEIPAHTVTNIVTTFAGWDTVDNAAAGATGRTIETRSEYENRRYNSVALNSHGSAEAVYAAVAAVEGVIDCIVYENVSNVDTIEYGVTVPGHGIAVCVYGGEDEAIAEAIYRKKGAGAATAGNYSVTYIDHDYKDAEYVYQIYRPEPVDFWVKCVIPGSSVFSAETLAQIRQAVVDDFLGNSSVSGNARVNLGTTVKASRFYPAVWSVTTDLLKIQIRMGDEGEYMDSVDVRADQEPVMTTDMVEITEE